MWVAGGTAEKERFQAFFQGTLGEIEAVRAAMAASAAPPTIAPVPGVRASCRLSPFAAVRAGHRQGAPVSQGTPAAQEVGRGNALLTLAYELSALLLLVRAAREGDLPLLAAFDQAAGLALAPLPDLEPARDLDPARGLSACAARLEALRERLVPLQAAALSLRTAGMSQGHGMKREKPLRRPTGRPRLHLVVTNP